MLPFFPTPYKDEHFYSIAARYNRRMGHHSKTVTMKELMGSDFPLSSTHLPCNLSGLTDKLPEKSMVTPKSIIKNNSMFPSMKPFINPERIAPMNRQMLYSAQYTSDLVTARVYFARGRESKQLRYCKACIDEEMKLYGEAYWHRSHQFQGVRICHKHGAWLNITDKCWLADLCKHFIMPYDYYISSNSTSFYNNNTKNYHHIYSKYVFNLLNNDCDYFDKSKLSSVYKTNLTNYYSKDSNYLFTEMLATNIRKYFGHDFLFDLNQHYRVGKYKSWLYYFFSDTDKYCYTILHILMMMFLNIDFLSLITLVNGNKSKITSTN